MLSLFKGSFGRNRAKHDVGGTFSDKLLGVGLHLGSSLWVYYGSDIASMPL